MSPLADVAELLKERREAGLSQQELARRAGVTRTTLARMETLAKGDMSVSMLRLLEGGWVQSSCGKGWLRAHGGGHSG